MNILLFLFVASTFSQWFWKNHGGYSVTYLEGDCNDDKALQVASWFYGGCINNPADGTSFQYFCSMGDIPAHGYNFSVEVYKGSNCDYDEIVNDIHLGDTEDCTTGPVEGSHHEWYCRENYKVSYSNLNFSSYLHPDKKDLGSSDNPRIGELFHPFLKCRKSAEAKYHMTVSCDANTQEGTMHAYYTRACLWPAKKITLKPGDIVDLGEFLEKKQDLYFKYDGCTLF